MILLGVIVAVAIVLFWFILQLDIPGLWKFILVFIEMMLVNQILIKKYKLPSELGLILVKSKKGIDIINGLAKKGKWFDLMADIGNTIAYGLLSFVITRRNTDFKTAVPGMVLLAILILVVGPASIYFISEILGFAEAEGTTTGASIRAGVDIYGLGAMLLFGGFFLLMLFGIVYFGALVLAGVIDLLIYGKEEVLDMPAGGHFLLPGVNLPLFEGILALVVIMIVHEGAHAVLARIGKIPVVSSGVVLFGVIPIGAFVEPEEKKLAKADEVRQSRVLVAGCTANLITSILVFILYGIVALGALYLGISGNGALDFIKTTLKLTFTLNFVVGVINLLPLPVFDGYRLIDVNLKNKTIVKALMYVTLLFFVLNFVPHFFSV
jgi:membrane-associated protease RseP (regulator of RpoE activity)